ncbi:hypothetical protein AFE_1424 [Acidithiobacillus ferrooxidans ATCC 23270]|uniref:Uncharacterized protein n=1 Tax=Acidithiobacillus ferrooxidans (strain ATCC 23270 / DSM 14882 / CIP 104768 / NCIMB 8455) TaxID=243159 RepID=B7J9M1_ACIF2|nr:hypothetical protein AFE_1424 [Acidithiobacillus ferrooxidans ATCC 23270]
MRWYGQVLNMAVPRGMAGAALLEILECMRIAAVRFSPETSGA